MNVMNHSSPGNINIKYQNIALSRVGQFSRDRTENEDFHYLEIVIRIYKLWKIINIILKKNVCSVSELHSHNNKLSLSLQAFVQDCKLLYKTASYHPKICWHSETPNINFTSNSSDASTFFMHCWAAEESRSSAELYYRQ